MEHLKRLGVLFFSGMAFAVGVGATSLVYEMTKHYFNPPSYVEVVDPTDLVINSFDPLSVTKKAGLSASIENRSSSLTYVPEGVEIRIFQGERQLASCEANLHGKPMMHPRAIETIQVECADVERVALPADVSYRFNIHTARRYRKARAP